MDAQARIHSFSLAAHRVAVARLREQPARLEQAAGPSHGDPCWEEWEHLLKAGPDAVALAVCSTSDHAATWRSVSPLGRFISATERTALLRQAREAA